MEVNTLKTKVLEEIDLIPEENLEEVYTLLHAFRLKVNQTQEDKNKILEFAGCWKDMPDEIWTEFTQSIEKRRQQSFSRRKISESSFD